MSIVGTRPEAIKMAPVVRALAARSGFQQKLVLTGQHGGLAPLFDDVAPEILHELPYDPRGRSATKLRETLHRLMSRYFQVEPADLVLVHGDTATALASAFAARGCGIAVGHVEAGLRSFDLSQPWPEEGNRMAIDAMAAILFAPTQAAAANLAADWRVKGKVVVTGNTGIDALYHARCTDVAPVEAGTRKTILVTCHRKENQGAKLHSICAALRRLVEELPLEILLPLHPNPSVRLGIEQCLEGLPHIHLVPGVSHKEMVRLMDRSWLILTDSGGIQEEGPALGKPVLVLRDLTERPEALASGSVELVGTATERILQAVTCLLRDPIRYRRMSRPSFPFGDGKAAPRIVDAIAEWLGGAKLAA